MEFIGCIELDQRNFSIYRRGTEVVVQKYMNGKKVEGALKTFTPEEFERFLDQLGTPGTQVRLNYTL